MSKIIKLYRGDTFNFVLNIDDESTLEHYYILRPNDLVYLGVTEPHQPFENAIIKKIFTAENCDTSGNIVITFNPEDTVNLEPGVYYYSIKLRKNVDDERKEEVMTVIPKTKFVILD